jgi:hypothetical protein
MSSISEARGRIISSGISGDPAAVAFLSEWRHCTSFAIRDLLDAPAQLAADIGMVFCCILENELAIEAPDFPMDYSAKYQSRVLELDAYLSEPRVGIESIGGIDLRVAAPRPFSQEALPNEVADALNKLMKRAMVTRSNWYTVYLLSWWMPEFWDGFSIERVKSDPLVSDMLIIFRHVAQTRRAPPASHSREFRELVRDVQVELLPTELIQS